MASSFPFPAVPVFGERECQGEPGVKGDRSVESHALLSLESLDKACGTGGEKLFQMLVRQFLVQESAVHGQSAPFIVATGTLFPDDNVSGPSVCRSIWSRVFSQLPVRETSATSMSFTAS